MGKWAASPAVCTMKSHVKYKSRALYVQSALIKLSSIQRVWHANPLLTYLLSSWGHIKQFNHWRFANL
ncbi:unnamed protein product [Cuscuta campestris]|uniref:Uncharacterized protein n=1 Tax=Cuscuta campestris TaxID=132261 RepID=A0A484LJ09_9ASTE|nr:unnamed protein product [Cuscuta campestris]